MSENQNVTDQALAEKSNSENSQNSSVSIDDMLEQNKKMFSALTSAMETAISGIGKHVHLSVNKLTDAVNTLTTHHANKLARVGHDPPPSESSDDEEGGESGDEVGGNDTVRLHAEDRALYNESISADAFLKSQDPPPTTPPQNKTDDLISGPVIEKFSDSYIQKEEKWGEAASENIKNVVSVAFKDTLSIEAAKTLWEKMTLPDNCKFAQARDVNPLIFTTVSASIRSTDIKLKEIQRDYSKATASLIKLLQKLPDILQKQIKGHDDNSSITEIIQIILDGLKMAGYGSQQMDVLRKRSLLAGVSREFRDLSKYAQDSESHLFGEEVEESLKKAKGRHLSLQALKPKAVNSTPDYTNKRKSTGSSKNDRPIKRPMIGHKGNYQNQVSLSPSHPKKSHKRDHTQAHHRKGRN